MNYTGGIFLLLGSNLGDRNNYLLACAQNIERVGIKILQKSKVYASAAWGKTDQPNFLNQAMEIEGVFTPIELLKIIKSIETSMDRIKSEKWGPRTIDIDILLFRDQTLFSEELTIPHKELKNRRFALLPLSEIAVGIIEPISMKSISELLLECQDRLDVWEITE